MHILFLNAGNETGGGMHHILQVMQALRERHDARYTLAVLEKKELYVRAKEAGIATVHFPHNKKWSLALLVRIIRFIIANKVTIVHTHGPRANVYMQVMKKFIAAKWIATVHSDPLVDFQHKGMLGTCLSEVHFSALRKADQIVSVCDAFRPLLVKKRLAKGNISTIHNGIDFHQGENPPIASYRQQHGFKEEDFLFVQVARLEAVKGHEVALRAFHQLIAAMGRASLHLLFIGDGALELDLKRLVEELRLEKQVHFYGKQADVEPFYQMANVTLLTSYSESFPYVCLESAKFKKPVITTKVGDVASIIRHEENGWKVAVGDDVALVQVMKKVVDLRESGALETIGEQLYRHAAAHFTLRHCADKLVQVYEAVQQHRLVDIK